MAEEFYFVRPVSAETIDEHDFYPSERRFAELILSKGLVLGGAIESPHEEVGTDGTLKTVVRRPDFVVLNPKRYAVTSEELIDPDSGKYRIRWGDPRWAVVEHTISQNLDSRKREQQRAMEETGLRSCVIQAANNKTIAREKVPGEIKGSFLYRSNALKRMYADNSLAADPNAEHLKARGMLESKERLDVRIEYLRDLLLTNKFVDVVSKGESGGVLVEDIFRTFGVEAGKELLLGLEEGRYPCMELFSHHVKDKNALVEGRNFYPVKITSKKKLKRIMKSRMNVHSLRLRTTRPVESLEEDCPKCDLRNRCQLRELLQKKSADFVSNREINELFRRDQLRSLFFDLQKLASCYLGLTELPDSVEVAKRFYGIDAVDENTDFGRLKDLFQIMKQDLINLRGAKYVETKAAETEGVYLESPPLTNRELSIEWLKALGVTAKKQAYEMIKQGMVNRYGEFLQSNKTEDLVEEFRQATRKEQIEIVTSIDFEKYFENSASNIFARRWNRYVFQGIRFREQSKVFQGQYSPNKVLRTIQRNNVVESSAFGKSASFIPQSTMYEQTPQNILFNKEP